MIVGASVVLVLLFIVPAILFYIFSKTKSPFKLGLLLGAIHFFLIIALAVFVYASIQRDGESVMLFLIPYGLDFPASFITLPLFFVSNKLGIDGFMVINFWIPSLVFSIFGSLQYFFIGVILGRLFKKVFRAKGQN